MEGQSWDTWTHVRLRVLCVHLSHPVLHRCLHGPTITFKKPGSRRGTRDLGSLVEVTVTGPEDSSWRMDRKSALDGADGTLPAPSPHPTLQGSLCSEQTQGCLPSGVDSGDRHHTLIPQDSPDGADKPSPNTAAELGQATRRCCTCTAHSDGL